MVGNGALGDPHGSSDLADGGADKRGLRKEREVDQVRWDSQAPDCWRVLLDLAFDVGDEAAAVGSEQVEVPDGVCVAQTVFGEVPPHRTGDVRGENEVGRLVAQSSDEAIDQGVAQVAALDVDRVLETAVRTPQADGKAPINLLIHPSTRGRVLRRHLGRERSDACQAANEKGVLTVHVQQNATSISNGQA